MKIKEGDYRVMVWLPVSRMGMKVKNVATAGEAINTAKKMSVGYKLIDGKQLLVFIELAGFPARRLKK